MSSQINILQNRINGQDERIKKLEQQVARHAAEAIANLSVASVEQGQRIEELEHRVALLTTRVVDAEDHAERIEKLEAALRDVARCLIDGKVDVDVAILGTSFHSHRILGAASVQTMVEVYHRLKAQMGDPGYDTP